MEFVCIGEGGCFHKLGRANLGALFNERYYLISFGELIVGIKGFLEVSTHARMNCIMTSHVFPVTHTL